MADVTGLLNTGTNEVVLEVIGGRKNILGPLHVEKGLYIGKGAWTGPEQFDTDNPGWKNEYQLTDHSIFGPVIIEYYI